MKLIPDLTKTVNFPSIVKNDTIGQDIWEFIFGNNRWQVYTYASSVWSTIGYVPIEFNSPENITSNQGNYAISIFHVFTNPEREMLARQDITLQYDETKYKPVGLWYNYLIDSPTNEIALKSFYTQGWSESFPIYGTELVPDTPVEKTYTFQRLKGQGLTISGGAANRVVSIVYDGLGGDLDVRNCPLREDSLLDLINNSKQVENKKMILSLTTVQNCKSSTLSAARDKGFKLYMYSNGSIIEI